MDASIGRLPLDVISLLVVNEIEAADLTDASSPDAMIAALRAQAPRAAVILTLGHLGAIYQDPEVQVSTPAWPVTAVDTTGAGDTFTGYLVASLLQGMPADQAMARAARAAALCVPRPGAADSIPHAAEVDALEAHPGGRRNLD
jgi:ribokinase